MLADLNDFLPTNCCLCERRFGQKKKNPIRGSGTGGFLSCEWEMRTQARVLGKQLKEAWQEEWVGERSA